METAMVWHGLLEDWDGLKNCYVNVNDLRTVALTIRQHFAAKYQRKIQSIATEGGAFIEEVFLLALHRVDWQQITERLVDMLRRQQEKGLS